MTTITLPNGTRIETTNTIWTHTDGGMTIDQAPVLAPAPIEPMPSDDILTFDEAEERLVDHMAEVAFKGGCFERDLIGQEDGTFLLKLRHNPDHLPCNRDTCPRKVVHHLDAATAYRIMAAYGRNILFIPYGMPDDGFFWIDMWD